MADRPIIFSGPMVRALLEGRKTQTRRVLNPQPRQTDRSEWYLATRAGFQLLSDPNLLLAYAIGDLLYVRESFARSEPGFAYMADHPGDTSGMGWKPSIHMPREASRLTLKVTDVRVEQIRAISDSDCVQEGIDPEEVSRRGMSNARLLFIELWDNLNHKRGFGFKENPWVVALTFEVHHCNVDQFNREVAA